MRGRQRTGSTVRLEGFSAHYNISLPEHVEARPLAWLLTWLLPAPVMLLAANRLSTGVGVRPRGDRVEVTVDFTADPNLMLAATTFIIGAISAVLEWPSHAVEELEARGFPVFAAFKPRRHTSRKGFLARADCFPANPFAGDPNAPVWEMTDGRRLSLRQTALEIARPFRRALRKFADAETVHHVFAVLAGKARSLLDFEDRPRAYEDVGRAIDWNRRRAIHELPRSRYERVIARIITHRPIVVDGVSWRPERMHGWYEIAFRESKTGRRRVFNLDELVRHCAA